MLAVIAGFIAPTGVRSGGAPRLGQDTQVPVSAVVANPGP